MNKQRRKALEALASQLSELTGKLDDIKSELENLRDEEQEYYDNMPGSLQNGEKGEAAQSCVEKMESVIEAIDTLLGEDTSLEMD